jgi:glycosyltransferase involved in cell wall biosynthesis
MDDFLGDGTAGLLFPVGATDLMIEGCIKIFENDALARRMGEAGRKRACEEYHQDTIVSRYEDLYKKTREEAKH